MLCAREQAMLCHNSKLLTRNSPIGSSRRRLQAPTDDDDRSTRKVRNGGSRHRQARFQSTKQLGYLLRVAAAAVILTRTGTWPRGDESEHAGYLERINPLTGPAQPSPIGGPAVNRHQMGPVGCWLAFVFSFCPSILKIFYAIPAPTPDHGLGFVWGPSKFVAIAGRPSARTNTLLATDTLVAGVRWHGDCTPNVSGVPLEFRGPLRPRSRLAKLPLWLDWD
ncbi:hypothetical protein BKA56DRAFT_610483 [Ilyonectria sp. MPI-CAGE-AT-0026]|nr:hypothetical protein BKA56DRAFT_610483 [Ilyonectria sp. MPI-CAGE-AT-0026]